MSIFTSLDLLLLGFLTERLFLSLQNIFSMFEREGGREGGTRLQQRIVTHFSFDASLTVNHSYLLWTLSNWLLFS